MTIWMFRVPGGQLLHRWELKRVARPRLLRNGFGDSCCCSHSGTRDPAESVPWATVGGRPALGLNRGSNSGCGVSFLQEGVQTTASVERSTIFDNSNPDPERMADASNSPYEPASPAWRLRCERRCWTAPCKARGAIENSWFDYVSTGS
jgi:hypothetical protein